MKLNVQKSYSNGDEGMSTLGKLGTGALAIGGTYFGARRGLFGTRVGMATNLFHGNMGSMIGSKSMVNSAATKYSKQFNRNIYKNTGLYDNLKGACGKDVAKNVSKNSTEAVKNQMTNFWNSGKKVDNIIDTVSGVDKFSKRVGNYGNFNRKGTEIKDNVTQLKRKVAYADRFIRIKGGNNSVSSSSSSWFQGNASKY